MSEQSGTTATGSGPIKAEELRDNPGRYVLTAVVDIHYVGGQGAEKEDPRVGPYLTEALKKAVGSFLRRNVTGTDLEFVNVSFLPATPGLT